MTDLSAAARRIVELARAVSAGTNAIACERRIRDLNDFITQEDLIPCLAADWLRLREVEKAARELFLTSQNEMVSRGLPLEWQDDCAMGRMQRALAALDKHRKEGK